MKVTLLLIGALLLVAVFIVYAISEINEAISNDSTPPEPWEEPHHDTPESKPK